METANINEDNPYADLPTRPMRVKVLYSFDPENKTNCLARFPNTLQIPAVAIDENSQVGVIELRQCIQAVLSASPEIISRLSDGDFAIYAFDYSEFETPLVGQGMLSTVMSSSSQAQNEEKTMITGRVCKNVPAIFSNGVKETLEVKLRMVPVAKVAQASIVATTDHAQCGSPAMSGGFDPNAWSMSLHQQKPQQSLQDYFNLAAGSSNQGHEILLGNEVFDLESAMSGGEQMLEGVGISQTPTGPGFGLNPAFATNSHSVSGSRTGSPVHVSESSTSNEHLRHQSFSGYPSTFVDHSRPASRTSVRSEVSGSRQHQRHASAHSLPPQHTEEQAEVYYNEDGLSRKRAKVVQTDWHGRSSFGSRSSDLRVTAAAANSMHMHRPIPKRANAPGSDLEPPPRVPTPVPQRHPFSRHQRPQISGPSRSMLRQASTADSDFMSDFDQYSDALASSPEDESPTRSMTAGGTPQDIPSSPPVFPGINQPQPSSPGLPALTTTHTIDSGYMSEQAWLSSNIMDSLETGGDCGQYAQDQESVAHPALQRGAAGSHSFIKTEGRVSNSPPVLPSDALASDIEFHMVMPGDESQLPRKMLLDLPPRRDPSLGPKASRRTSSIQPSKSVQSTQKAAPHAPSAGTGAPVTSDTSGGRLGTANQPTSRRGSLALPPNLPRTTSAPMVSASRAPSVRAESQKPEQRRRKPLKRSRTQADSEAGSPAPSDNEGRPRGPKRSGSGATRRMVIQDRLEQSLASGAAPQFCAHCGAIETPTWRRLYVKHVDGKPCPLDEAEGEGEIIGVEATKWDEASGEVVQFVIRKSLKRDKNSKLPKPGDDFEDTTLCNPCGLWFNKTRTMRPAERWGKKPRSRLSKKAREADGGGLMTDSLEPQSEAYFTDAVEPEEGSDDVAANELSSKNTDEDNRMPAANKRRATSLQPEQQHQAGAKDKWNASQLNAALSRQVQSSPVRFGSQTSPIEIDEFTPKPTRRLLFPSPRKDGEVKSLDDNGQASLNAALPASKDGPQKPASSSKLAITSLNTDVSIFEAFTSDKENVGPPLHDFDGLTDLFGASPSSVFKTPRKTPAKNRSPHSQEHLSHLLKTPTSASRKRKALSVNKNAINAASASRVSASAAAMHDFMTSPSSSRYFLRSTPSRVGRTPGRANTSSHDQVSPFSRQLAEMLSDNNMPLAGFTSPSRGSGAAFDFSDLPTFTTPGRQMDWSGIDDMLQSSEFATFEEDCAGVGSSSSRD